MCALQPNLMTPTMREQSYRLAAYVRGNDEPRAGIVVDDGLLDVSALLTKSVTQSSRTRPTQVLQALEQWHQLHALLQQAARSAKVGINIPIPVPVPVPYFGFTGSRGSKLGDLGP